MTILNRHNVDWPEYLAVKQFYSKHANEDQNDTAQLNKQAIWVQSTNQPRHIFLQSSSTNYFLPQISFRHSNYHHLQTNSNNTSNSIPRSNIKSNSKSSSNRSSNSNTNPLLHFNRTTTTDADILLARAEFDKVTTYDDSLSETVDVILSTYIEQLKNTGVTAHDTYLDEICFFAIARLYLKQSWKNSKDICIFERNTNIFSLNIKDSWQIKNYLPSNS